MVTNTHELIIVGGGPVGLNAALLATKHQYDFLLLEGQEKLGGQLIELYPEKEIIDLSGHESILAKDYVDWLVDKFDDENKARLLTNQKVSEIISGDETIIIKTAASVYHAKAVIIATGLGVYMPRLLECHGAEGCRNIIYALHRLEFLKDKRVAIMGGGDAAIDWARDISKHTPHVTLVHRRNEFRGNVKVLEGIKTLKVMTPYAPLSVLKHGDEATMLEIENIDTKAREKLQVDYIFVNYGHIPVGASFGLEKFGPGLKVTASMETSSSRIFAVGDVSNYDNKKRRIDVGINEVSLAFDKIKQLLNR